MNLQDFAKQYRGATLPKLVEKQIKAMSEETLLKAIRGTYDNLPVQLLPQIDAFTQDYIQNWLGPYIVAMDLGDLFNATVEDIRRAATEAGDSLADEQIFDVFNVIVLKLSFFASSQPQLRKLLGIKKGWFS